MDIKLKDAIINKEIPRLDMSKSLDAAKIKATVKTRNINESEDLKGLL